MSATWPEHRATEPGFTWARTCPNSMLSDLPTTVTDVGTASPARSSSGVIEGGAGPTVNDPSGSPLPDVAAPDRSAPDAVPGSLPAGSDPQAGRHNP